MVSGVRFVRMSPELFGLIPLEYALQAGHVALHEASRAAACAAPNVALAMVEGGRVLGAAGVSCVWPGRGYAWFMAGAAMQRRHFLIALRRCLVELRRLQTAGMWRIECTTQSSVAAHGLFVRRMGFCFEGTMHRFMPDGTDHDLWALLPATYDERRSLIERVAA